MTKKLASSLVTQGHEVSILVPMRPGKTTPSIPGVTVSTLTFHDIFSFKKVFKSIDADVYHSQNPNIFTFFALLAQPKKKHVITCRDPRDLHDWIVEIINATWKRKIKTPLVYLFEDGPFISYAIRKADVVGCPAYFLKEKVKQLYGRKDVILLPNIERIPDSIPQKAKEPTVCFVGRLDRRKRPEILFELAEKFSKVRFLIVGKAEDRARQIRLEHIAEHFKNVKMLGYIDKYQSTALEDIYDRSWILLNTSAREGLPMTFIEAASHGCAILSTVNPDGFATKYGYFATSVDKLSEGLDQLLKDNCWEERGNFAFHYVASIYKEENAIKVYLEMYDSLLDY